MKNRRIAFAGTIVFLILVLVSLLLRYQYIQATEIIEEFAFHFNGTEGDVVFCLHYARDITPVLSVKNNTKHTLLFGEPVLLCIRTKEKKWKPFDSAATGAFTIAGIERIIERGGEWEVQILPSDALQRGTYMIDVSDLRLEISEPGKEPLVVEPTEQSRQLIFQVP